MADTAWIDRLVAALGAAGDPQRAVEQQRYMKSALPYHGITTPELQRLLRPFLTDAATRLTSRATWEETVRALWDGATHREQRYAALALTGHRLARSWQDPSALTLYRHLVVTGAWWDVVDTIAARRVGPIVAAHPAVGRPLMRAWADDDDLWIRRTAILHQLGAKADTDAGLLAEIVEANLAGSPFAGEFFVRKAIGWALRQYAYTDPAWVRRFLRTHADRLAALSVREAAKHLAD